MKNSNVKKENIVALMFHGLGFLGITFLTFFVLLMTNTVSAETFTPACYIKNHEYRWMTSDPGTGWTKVSSVSQTACKDCESGYQYNSSGACVQQTSTSEPAHTITFMQAQGYVSLVQCQTGSDGKIASIIGKYECDYNPATNCVDAISFWCSQWSTDSYYYGTQTNNITSSAAFGTKTFTSDMVYYCVANTSSHSPTNCSSNPEVPDEPTPDPAKSCYKCMSGTIPKYVYAYSDSEAATATGGTGCTKTDDSKCTQSKECCYECTKNGSKVYNYNENPDAAASKTGGSNCVCASSNSYCNPSDVPVNPPTGTVAVIIAWVVGLLAVGYAAWYFIKLQSIK